MVRFRSKAKLRRMQRYDLTRRYGPAQPPSSFIVYALDVGHLVLTPRPVEEYERVALFKERARASVTNGQYFVEFPRKVYDQAKREAKRDFVTGCVLSGEPSVLNTDPEGCRP